jgi:phage pi2 protein 07
MCQKNLPYQFVTKEEYKELLNKRNQQWEMFIDKFEKLITRFWNHSHDTNGKVDTQGK